VAAVCVRGGHAKIDIPTVKFKVGVCPQICNV